MRESKSSMSLKKALDKISWVNVLIYVGYSIYWRWFGESVIYQLVSTLLILGNLSFLTWKVYQSVSFGETLRPFRFRIFFHYIINAGLLLMMWYFLNVFSNS
jgi:hypothetical protein